VFSGIKKTISGLAISGIKKKLAMPTSATHCNLGQPMAVKFCPFLILISVEFFAFIETLQEDFWHLKGL
jgi:hypothetical protein